MDVGIEQHKGCTMTTSQTASQRAYSLTSDELDQFNRDGYLGPFDLYEPDEMAAYLRLIRVKTLNTKDAVYSTDNSFAGATNLASYDRHLDVDFLGGHIARPEIVDRVVSILGPDVLCWRSEFFPKYPGDEGTDWHQADNFSHADASGHPQIVWPEDEDFGGAVTVWTAFTEATTENGCLQFIPGTHTSMNYDESKVMQYDATAINEREKRGVRRGFYGYDYRQLQKDPDWEPDESSAVSMVMRPGQFIIFWSTLMHASLPNNSKTMRLGYTGRYVPNQVRVYPFSNTLREYGGDVSLERFACVQVAGHDTYHHNKIIEPMVDWSAGAAGGR
jgi:non-heme Fe2+,alpha-ketoglutarate-dependent halogenase